MTSGRRLDYDMLRIFSMVAVVYLHGASDVLRLPTQTTLWSVANGLTSLFTVAVPLFFMLSGALLLSHKESLSLNVLFKKRLPKIFIPLTSWSVLILIGYGIMEGADTALTMAGALLNTPVMVPYWFLYALIPMYLISPFLKAMSNQLTGAHWRYGVGLWLILTMGLNTIKAFLPWGPLTTLVTVHWTINLNFLSGYLGYFILGAALARWEKLPKPWVLWLSGIGCYLIIALGTRYITYTSGTYDETFKSYLHIFVPLLASSLFLLCKHYWQKKTSPPWVIALSGLSFGVYLLHPLIIKAVDIILPIVLQSEIDTLPEHLLYTLFIVLGSGLGSLLLSSIPVLCYLLTGQKFKTASRESNLIALCKHFKQAK